MIIVIDVILAIMMTMTIMTKKCLQNNNDHNVNNDNNDDNYCSDNNDSNGSIDNRDTKDNHDTNDHFEE